MRRGKKEVFSVCIVLLAVFFCILNISVVSAIFRINEIEANPIGNDSGNEWVELYSSKDVDLTGYKIMNNDGESVNLSGEFSGYYVYEFTKQFLDNSNEKVLLYDLTGTLVDETKTFSDTKNDEFTWQYCSGKWYFLKSTKRSENKCDTNTEGETNTSDNSEDENPNVDSDTESNKDNVNTNPKNQDTNANTNTITSRVVDGSLNVIKLDKVKDTTKTTSTDKINTNSGSSSKNFAIYGLGFFCVLLCLLFLFLKLAKSKTYKSEFTENSGA